MELVAEAQKQFTYDPEEISSDLYAIPLPLFDGSPVNAYVVRDGQEVWLIDGGLASDECQAVLERGLARLGHSMADIRGLLITHGHTDHVGAARRVLANGGQVLAHRVENDAGRRLGFDQRWLVRNGLPEDEVEDSHWHTPDWPSPTRLLEGGEVLHWGTLELRVVWCPGHTSGLICLFEPRRGLLFTTDHVMRRAPAPVTLRAPSDGDPLADYLSSIRKLAKLSVDTVLPGHGRPFGGLAQRLAAIEAEVERQLDQIRSLLARGSASAVDLLAVDGLRDRRAVAERYSLSQVLARLRHLENRGEIVRADNGSMIRYALVTGATIQQPVG